MHTHTHTHMDRRIQRERVGPGSEKMVTSLLWGAAFRATDADMAALHASRDLTRTWIVVDMDAFYASVEERDSPFLVWAQALSCLSVKYLVTQLWGGLCSLTQLWGGFCL